MYKKIGIIVAIPEELEMIHSIMESPVVYQERKWQFARCYFIDKEVVVILSGMGKVNSAMAAMEMVKEFSPDCIINTGVAGGVDKKIKVVEIQ